MAAFTRGFEYEPTSCQQSAFEAVEADMCAETVPMDRLICGDVGFGKTEIAMRGIYRMVCARPRTRCTPTPRTFHAVHC